MYLKRLEIQGFKSFADKTVLHFGDDITAIVGPNGSGKSNISDAISWVMGEMSSKALRGSKMEDVIFGGTQKRGQVGFAEATLVLDNSDGALPVETSEVMVTRRYYRSGESEYYINKQSARLRDINEMFMDTGLGKEGYSNIGQGRIDEILAVKSTDRREVFEEAAGISKFRHRKEETERRLASTEDNLMRIGDKISELELQVEPLRAQAEKAKKFLELRDELKGLEIAVWLEKLRTLADAAQKAEADYTSAAFILEQQHSELTRLYQMTEQLTMQLNHQSLELDQKREKITLREGELHQKESETAVLQAGVENARQNIARVRQELAEQQDRSGGVGEQIAQQERRIEEIAGSLASLLTELETAQKEADKLAASADSAERKALGLRASQALLQTEAARKRAEIASIDASLEESRQRRDTVQEDLDAATQRRDDLAQQAKTFRAALEEAQETVTSCKNSAAGYALRQKSRTDKRDALQKEVDSLRIELQTAQSRSHMLQEMLRDHEGAPKAVRIVMQEAGRSLRNIHGPVSSLIRTDDDYTVAIETALGAGMQNVVVDSEEDGKAAMQYLKRCDGGRATFLPISTMRGKLLQEQGLEQCPGFVGVASSLVRCDKVYTDVVRYLLGRIVLVETLDHAIKMARKYQNRFKIVTLDGQVMNAGGSMTGGSVSKSSGILSRANELTRLQEKEQKLKEKLQEKERELTEATRSAAQVEFELSAIQGQLRQAEDDVLRAQGDFRQASALVEALEANIHAYERELESIKERTAGEDGRLNILRADAEKAEQEVVRLETELEEMAQGQTALSQQTNTLADKITSLRMDEAALEAERTTARESVQRLRSLADAMEGDRGQKEQLIAVYEQEICDLQAKIARSEEEKKLVEDALAEARQELQQSVQKRAETEAKRVKTDKDVQDKNKDILDMEREAARLEQKKNSAAMEEQQILDKLWDSYELTPSTAEDFKAQIESTAAANKRISELKRKISGLGTPNLGAIEEFARVNERYEYLTGQRDDVLHAKKELENIVATITEEMTEIFVREFTKINEHFSKTFVEMFGGGKGELVLEDAEQPLSCGIEIRVQPPGKQLKTITLLSGGEKAFVAIALYFAILKVRPTPFCLLDEIDAALDDRNVERFASYLRNLCEKTQFIVITHRRGTMEASDVLYGVTMQEQGVSKILHLDLNQMQQELGIAN
ncbi:MAG: chromosome segregation protein SMC [Oscillospiraceae bacterium]|nr:chromosome segregation protein SMC [Oscillospiraceae bacterium]